MDLFKPPMKKQKPPVEVKINGRAVEREAKDANTPEERDAAAYLQARVEIRKLRRKHPNLGPATIEVKPGSGSARVSIDSFAAMDGAELP